MAAIVPNFPYKVTEVAAFFGTEPLSSKLELGSVNVLREWVWLPAARGDVAAVADVTAAIAFSQLSTVTSRGSAAFQDYQARWTDLRRSEIDSRQIDKTAH